MVNSSIKLGIIENRMNPNILGVTAHNCSLKQSSHNLEKTNSISMYHSTIKHVALND